MFLRIILFLSADYLLCSKISKLFLQKEIEIPLIIPAFFLFLNFSKDCGFILLLTALLLNIDIQDIKNISYGNCVAVILVMTVLTVIAVCTGCWNRLSYTHIPNKSVC